MRWDWCDPVLSLAVRERENTLPEVSQKRVPGHDVRAALLSLLPGKEGLEPVTRIDGQKDLVELNIPLMYLYSMYSDPVQLYKIINSRYLTPFSHNRAPTTP